MSGWAAVAVVPTITLAIYGTAFSYLPWLSIRYGILILLGITTVLCWWFNFKKRHWL